MGELGWALFWVVGETPRTTLPPGGVAIVVGVGILGGRDVVVVVGVGILGGRRDNMIKRSSVASYTIFANCAQHRVYSIFIVDWR